MMAIVEPFPDLFGTPMTEEEEVMGEDACKINNQ
jgi:hypothetical protein